MQLKEIKPGEAQKYISDRETHISFSQFGEDLIIWAILRLHKRLDNGFYVDVGAFDPVKCSNTALLHLFRGWKGVNIDANPDAIRMFDEHRPGDFNIVAAVSDEETDHEYVRFNHPGLNTLDPAMEQRQTREGTPFKVTDRFQVRTRTLRDILDGLDGVPERIGLLNVDCEGFDLRVLHSNDWDRYRPFVIAVEAHGLKLRKLGNDPVHNFLAEMGYRLVSHAFVTSVYVNTSA
ncbi:MAG: FkbM family methyltransferase [Rhizomicrobium sp.]|jgi:FkbM family methyltransferase